ncbi:phosphoribosylformylglycinamidine synthase subunit PurQ [bacterium]|nr:phosphoribosylformylglycinamidine synthase subunit PurQ [bacterium]
MKIGVVTFPGSNCDYDTLWVGREVLKQDTTFLWHNNHDLKDCDLVVIPGGFSYGDYLRTGGIARFSPIMKEVVQFAGQGGMVLGICNGFQILMEAGLLPGAMLQNKSIRFISRFVYVKTINNQIPFTGLLEPGDVLKIPIAHYEGNYFAPPEILSELEKGNRIVFRYCDQKGNVTPESNPNGSLLNIAGICNEQGNVLGMMPHPERASEEILGSRDGLNIFRSAMQYFQRYNS